MLNWFPWDVDACPNHEEITLIINVYPLGLIQQKSDDNLSPYLCILYGVSKRARMVTKNSDLVRQSRPYDINAINHPLNYSGMRFRCHLTFSETNNLLQDPQLFYRFSVWIISTELTPSIKSSVPTKEGFSSTDIPFLNNYKT